MNSFFKDSRVLVTGHTGFKGSWLVKWLELLGAKTYGIALEPTTNPSMFSLLNMNETTESSIFNILDINRLRESIKKYKPDFIFHLAAQPIVSDSYVNPVETFQVNLLGSINLLDVMKDADWNCSIVMITSDKCYENLEWTWGYRENDRLGGADPYSASKACAEIGISSMYRSFFKDSKNIKICTARAGNVIGGGDWAQNRIVPDCIRSWKNNNPVTLRSPNSTRPWQHVLEPLSGYLQLSKKLYENDQLSGESFNFGPSSMTEKTVKELVTNLSKILGYDSLVEINDKNDSFHEAGLLKLNCDKSSTLLNWSPILNFEETSLITADWYKQYLLGNDLMSFTENQINIFNERAFN